MKEPAYPMEMNYKVTEEDYIDFNVYHSKNSETVKRSLIIQRITVPLMYVLLAMFFSYLLDLPFLVLLIPFLILAALWIIFYPAYFFRHIGKTAKKMIREGRNNGVLGDYTMVLSEDGLREISKTGEKSVAWSGIEKLGEDQTNFYLYNSGMSAFILPKRNLGNVEEVRSFLQSKQKN